MAQLIALVSDDSEWLSELERKLQQARPQTSGIAFERMMFEKPPLFVDDVAMRVRLGSALRKGPYRGVVLHSGHTWGIPAYEIVDALALQKTNCEVLEGQSVLAEHVKKLLGS